MGEDSLFGFLSMLFDEEEQDEDEGDCTLESPHERGMMVWDKRKKDTERIADAILSTRREP